MQFSRVAHTLKKCQAVMVGQTNDKSVLICNLVPLFILNVSLIIYVYLNSITSRVHTAIEMLANFYAVLLRESGLKMFYLVGILCVAKLTLKLE